MTDLSEVAFAFARECMGWEDAAVSLERKAVACHGGHVDDWWWYYGDLNEVMAAFRSYLKTHPGWLWSIERCPETDYVLVTIVYGDDSSGRAEIFNENMCHALLAACVEAQRKMARVA